MADIANVYLEFRKRTASGKRITTTAGNNSIYIVWMNVVFHKRSFLASTSIERYKVLSLAATPDIPHGILFTFLALGRPPAYWRHGYGYQNVAVTHQPEEGPRLHLYAQGARVQLRD